MKDTKDSGPKNELEKLQREVARLQALLDEREGENEELRQRTHMLELILQTIGDGVIVTDTDLNVKVYNEAATSLYGKGAVQMGPEGWASHYQIYSPDGERRLELDEFVMTRVARGEHVEQEEILVRSGEGESEHILSCTGAPLLEGDKVIGGVVTFRNVTEKRRSEERLRVLEHALEQSGTLVVITDMGGRVQYVNQKFRDLTGFSDEEVIGQLAADLTEQGPLDTEELWQALQDGHDWIGELRNRKKNGETYWELATISPVRDRDGWVTHLIKVAEDITERREIEERLRESESRFRVLVESDVIGIMLSRHDGTLVSVNDYFLKMTGYTREDFDRGLLNWRDLTPPEYLAENLRWVDDVASGKSSIPWEKEYIRKDGTRVPVMVGVAPLQQASDAEFIAFGLDLSKQKNAEGELRRTADELARSNADLQQFAYIASHDLREPLRMVAGFLQLVADRYRGKVDADADKYIGYAQEAATRMQALINDLLEYSRVGVRDRGFEIIDTSAAFDLATADLRATIEESGARIRRADLPRVHGDRYQISRLFQNLLANAIKFRSQATPTISVDVHLEAGEWVFAVRDNGIGIDTKYQSRLFNIFGRVPAAREYPGNGIGLAICKKIVELHGGRIWVESRAGKGSTFYFTIPNQR
jgi:PAS domain S-box-containing protein